MSDDAEELAIGHAESLPRLRGISSALSQLKVRVGSSLDTQLSGRPAASQ